MATYLFQVTSTNDAWAAQWPRSSLLPPLVGR